jgi:hypothetical protein
MVNFLFYADMYLTGRHIDTYCLLYNLLSPLTAMIWIALVLVIAIYLFFLCRDPGATMGCIFVVFIVICLIVGCFQSQANKREREEAEIAAQRERDRIARKKLEDMVKINVSYDTSGCPANYPLLVTIANHSAKTVLKSKIGLRSYRPGFSTQLALENEYEMDKILKPTEKYSWCLQMPRLLRRDGIQASILAYEADKLRIRFEGDSEYEDSDGYPFSLEY